MGILAILGVQPLVDVFEIPQFSENECRLGGDVNVFFFSYNKLFEIMWVFFATQFLYQPYHPWDWYIYLHEWLIFTVFM